MKRVKIEENTHLSVIKKGHHLAGMVEIGVAKLGDHNRIVRSYPTGKQTVGEAIRLQHSFNISGTCTTDEVARNHNDGSTRALDNQLR